MTPDPRLGFFFRIHKACGIGRLSATVDETVKEFKSFIHWGAPHGSLRPRDERLLPLVCIVPLTDRSALVNHDIDEQDDLI
jgi:hypothetical protein